MHKAVQKKTKRKRTFNTN